MTMIQIKSIGFCSHFCERGDRAFEWALSFARRQMLQLNIFRFSTHPYSDLQAKRSADPQMTVSQDPVALEKELRLYYEERCGDYVDVGFRVCDGNGWNELHRCLMNRQFQLLVLAYEKAFMGVPIEKFANQFISPVVLVGPDAGDEITINTPAALIADALKLDVNTPVVRAVPDRKQSATVLPIPV